MVRGLVVNMLDLHVARALNVDLYIHIETSTKTELPTDTDADTREQVGNRREFTSALTSYLCFSLSYYSVPYCMPTEHSRNFNWL